MQQAEYQASLTSSKGKVQARNLHVFLIFFTCSTVILLFACLQLQFEILKYIRQNSKIFASMKSMGIYNQRISAQSIHSSPQNYLRSIQNNQIYEVERKEQKILSLSQPIIDDQVSSQNLNRSISLKKQRKVREKLPKIEQKYLSIEQVQRGKQFLLINKIDNLDLINEERSYYVKKYGIDKFDQLPICVVVPSYNNAVKNRYLDNINSILQQEYSNYHIIFIDDYSDDGTGILMQQYAKNHSISSQKLKIVINEKRLMALKNIYRAANLYCKPYQLFIVIDGDDQLIGRQVFKLFNSIFQTYDTWLVYSNYLYEKIKDTLDGGFSRSYSEQVISHNSFRKQPFYISHLRVFYTKLILLIKQQDLKDAKQKWYTAGNDVAIYFPILQMCQKRMGYIPQITYLYNSNTGQNNHKTKPREQKMNEARVREGKSYEALNELFTSGQKNILSKWMLQPIL